MPRATAFISRLGNPRGHSLVDDHNSGPFWLSLIDSANGRPIILPKLEASGTFTTLGYPKVLAGAFPGKEIEPSNT